MRNVSIIPLLVALQFLACSYSALDSGGSGTEITNGITGRVLYPGGKPVAGAIVLHRRIDAVSDTLLADSSFLSLRGPIITDSKGWFTITSIDTGTYSIEINDRQSNAVLLHCAVNHPDSMVKLSQDTLLPTGTIRGVVSSSFHNPGSVYVFVHGLNRVSRIDPITGSFFLADMPEGNYTLSVTAPALIGMPKLVDRVQVASTKTTTLDTVPLPANSEWPFFKKLVLNTTATGASVAGTVTNFPLLVRLQADNFDFGTANNSGADIRFTKTDGKALPHEIEEWDPVARRAAIWVKMDTIFGNNNTQFLWMHWGNAIAKTISNGSTVFDSSSGFQGVWHLADNAANPVVKDALGKNNGTMRFGTMERITAPSSIEGVVGRAVDFQGASVSHWIDLGANRAFVNNKKEMSISMWMNLDPAIFFYGDFLCFSKGGALSAFPESRISLQSESQMLGVVTHPVDNSSTRKNMTAQAYPFKTWVYVVGVVKLPADSMYLYINGDVVSAVSVDFTTQKTSSTNSTNSSIGSDDAGTNHYVRGKIDEARIEGVARTPDWIRLNYENLKVGGKLIDPN